MNLSGTKSELVSVQEEVLKKMRIVCTSKETKKFQMMFIGLRGRLSLAWSDAAKAARTLASVLREFGAVAEYYRYDAERKQCRS